MKILKNFWPWDVTSLTKALRDDMPVHEGMYGLFFYIIFIIIPSYSRTQTSNKITLSVIEAILGSIVLYILNKKAQNKKFVIKIVCLTLPVTLRILVLAFIIAPFFAMIPAGSQLKENYFELAPHLFNLLGFTYLGRLILKT